MGGRERKGGERESVKESAHWKSTVETYGRKQERHREKKAASLDPAPALSRERSRSLTTRLFSHRCKWY